MKKLLLVALLASFSFGLSAYASDYGVLAKTYPIQEEDLIVVMQRKMAAKVADGTIGKEMDKLKAKSKGYVVRPVGVSLPRTGRYKMTKIDVRYTLHKDILDANGKIIYPAGTTINPLEIYPMKNGFCFIDGDDRDQVAWAKEMCNPSNAMRIVLVNGNYEDVAQKLNIRIYFDQKQTLTKRFNILSVPTVIRQSGSFLVKEAFPIEH
jgi:conjugal transfer pilus assembly protein TraW